MILKIFAVYDSKAECYLQPFMTDTVGLAIRSFTNALQKPEHGFTLHPEDYTLFQIAEWDNKTAQYKSLPTPKSLGLALEFMPVVKSSDNGRPALQAQAPVGNP